MGKIDYKAIYAQNQDEWKALTREPQKYEALLAGHYSDSNHFIYELLQNAEDAFDEKTGVCASKAVIEYYSDQLIFYHNGKPFDEADVRGVSSMLMGTKDKEDAQTIGRFGMGFKSVFKYTYQPEIYSDDEAFKITNYLLPVEITEGWDYRAEKESVVCKLGEDRSLLPFCHEEHLTKIVIPFKKYRKNGELVSVPGDDVLKKLDSLNGEILLFLTHIQSLYWVNKENGKFAHITIKQDEKDEKLITCHIEGTDYGEKEEISRYLKFRKLFNHKEMKNAEVSVAYKLNSRADNINEAAQSPVWVYFPTRDETDLPFLIHGSFETAVSREKLMTPSAFNDSLFDVLGDLIADSMKELARRNLITQVFIRRSLMSAFEDEAKNNTIPRLKEKVTRKIRQTGLLPDRKGEYRKPEDMFLPIPYRMADFADRPFFNNVFKDKIFVAFNNEREAKFGDYFNWLVHDLGIKTYKLSDFADDLEIVAGNVIPKAGEQFEALETFYDFLSDNRESVYETGLSYIRSGSYESAIRQDIKTAWQKLRSASIILNGLNQLVPAQVGRKAVIYLGSSSEYKSITQSALVNKSIADAFSKVLCEGFHIQKFDNFQFIKEKVIQKYVNSGKKPVFANPDDFTEEYVEDLRQIFALMKEINDVARIKELLKNAYIIKVKPESDEDKGTFNRPGFCYTPKSEEGLNLNIYYKPIQMPCANIIHGGQPSLFELAEYKWYGLEVNAIDLNFYEQNGIALSELTKLGLITTPVEEGQRSSKEGIGDYYWVAVGEYCPEIWINGLEENLKFIVTYPQRKLAKQKSAEILKFLLSISHKLQGTRKYRKKNPYTVELEETYILCHFIRQYKWLYDKDFNVCRTSQMSCYDLNQELYGTLYSDKEAYEILGFIKKEADHAEEALQKAQNLNQQDKKRLIDWLARDLGLQVSEPKLEDDRQSDDDSETFFDPDTWQDDEFPVKRVYNIDYLIRHVQEQFYCADPITYRKVLRQIRVSKNAMADRSYAIGMYTNSGNTKICQICRKPMVFIEVNQIANFGIEMPQLKLCLCRECSAKYRTIRDGNKDEFKKQIKEAIISMDVQKDSMDYSIELSADMVLHFTQAHIAEIQEILRLLTEYGVPSENV